MMRMTLGRVAAALVIWTFLGAAPSYSQTAAVDTTGSDLTVAAALAENLADHENANDYAWDANDVTDILLDDGGTAVNGFGAVVEGNTVLVKYAGTYRVSGALSDGQIRVKTKDDGTVRLILAGVSLHCSTSAPLFIKNADRAVLILAPNTENHLSDGKIRMLEDPNDEEPNAVIFTKENLTICGEGSLGVNAAYRDGIAGKDGLLVAGGTIVVNAVDDGIRGKDYLVIRGGDIAVTAGGKGLKADNDTDATAGYVLIEGGAVNVTSQGDAIAAATDLLIAGGELTLTSGGGSGRTVSGTASAKALKATTSLVIDGGTFTIDSADDALHSDASIAVNGGTFAIATADDGIHAEAALGINGGDINITKCYEGIESTTVILLNGGTVHIVASDDGVNVGTDTMGMGGGPGGGGWPGMGGGGNPNTATTSNCYFYIHGGRLAITAAGDGIDINGSVVMTGGTVLVNGPTANDNGALDYDSTFNISGGCLIAAGSSGMAMAPSASSTQYSILVKFNSTFQAGALFRIQANDGTEVVTFAPSKQYQTVAFSSPTLKKSTSYTIYCNGSYAGTLEDGLYTDGTYTAGSKYANFTITSMVTNVTAQGGGGTPPVFR
jgi:hypothetical protein